MNFFTDSKEWKWLFRNAIEWETIIPLYIKSFPTEDGIQNQEELIAFYEELLSAIGEWTAETLAPRAKILDKVGAGEIKDGKTYPSEVLQASYNEAKELGIFGITVNPELGGMGLPVTVAMLGFANMNRACLATSTQMGFFASIADMLERFCSKEDCERFIPKILEGSLSGSMNLTEPGSGSDLGGIKTTAEKLDNGMYKINGSKIFITNAGGGIGFVLAKIKGGPEGLEGISLFLVEQEYEGRLNFKVVKNEDKLGLHGSFTCEVLYEDSIGKLIGEEHKGFQYMLHLMNEARISVGLQCIGGMEACLGYAREYAETRQQFGKPIAELPLFKRILEDWETERDAFRALMVDTVQYFDMYQHLHMKKQHVGELTDEEKKLYKRALKWVRRRTPLVKYYGAETFTLLSQRAIQSLGGYGFMMEYDAQRWHRDSFAPLLYEGTSQIQSLMAMKDLLKFIMKNPSKFFQTMVYSHPLGGLINSTNELDRIFRGHQYDFKKNLSSLIVKTLKPDVNYTSPSEVVKLFNAKNWMTEDSFSKLMIHAETICQAMSYLETLRVLRLHAKKDQERMELFNRYHKLIMPRLEAIWTEWKNT